MVLHVLSMYYIQYYNPQQVGNKMPLKAELDAVQKNYVKLMKLPVKDLLPALKMVPIYMCVCVLHAWVHGCVQGCRKQYGWYSLGPIIFQSVLNEMPVCMNE